MRKLVNHPLRIVVIGCLLAMPGAAMADSAASGWNDNMGFSSPSQEANAFNKAQALWLIKRGVNPNVTSVTNSMSCNVAGSCQQGGTATNWNGVSVTTVEGDGNNITVDIDAEADQTAVSTSASGEFDIGNINF